LLVLCPQKRSVAELSNACLLMPFSEPVSCFLAALSQRLLRHSQSKVFPELMALGFWLREGNIKKLQLSLAENKSVLHKPLGTVVHYAPANVDSMFIYSWVCALLMGNKNIVRLSSQPSVVKDILITELELLFAMPEFQPVADCNLFVSFAHDDPVSSGLSMLADARVIWGGDESVTRIRQLPTHPKCRDIAFADRYSSALIDTDSLKADDDYTELADKLWRDVKPYAQMACSSPRVIFTLGQQPQGAMQKLAIYMERLAQAAEQSINHGVEHLVTSQLMMSQQQECKVIHQGRVSFLLVGKLSQQSLNWHCGQAMFYVLQLEQLNDISGYVSDKLQTLSYWGLDKQVLIKILSEPSITGIDRVVPVGQALDFSNYWDGYELLTQLSRALTTV